MKPMFDAEEFGTRIRVAAARQAVSLRSVGRDLELSAGTMSRISRGIGTPELEHYLRLTQWLERVEAK